MENNSDITKDSSLGLAGIGQDRLPERYLTDTRGQGRTYYNTADVALRGQLNGALAKARAEFAEIERSKTVTVRPKDGGASYTFDYAPLDAIFAGTTPALSKYGLCVWHEVNVDDKNVLVVTTVLGHESGAERRMDLKPPVLPGKIQELGSCITYLKRYGTEAILGICAETDDDGNAADNNHRDMRDRAPATKAAAPAAKAPAKTLTVIMEPPVEVAAADVISAETDKAIGELFKKLGLSRPAATAECQKATGKTPAQLTESDGRKLADHLTALVAAKGA